MVQSSTSLRKAGHQLLNWAAVIVLVLSVVIFTAIKGTAFFSTANLVNILRAMSIDHLRHGGHRLHGSGWIRYVRRHPGYLQCL